MEFLNEIETSDDELVKTQTLFKPPSRDLENTVNLNKQRSSISAWNSLDASATVSKSAS